MLKLLHVNNSGRRRTRNEFEKFAADDEERQFASNFPKLLSSEKSTEQVKKELQKLGFDVDYIEETDGRRFGAVHVGKVRLIDNVEI
jgi:pantoate--beta-alanine ligase